MVSSIHPPPSTAPAPRATNAACGSVTPPWPQHEPIPSTARDTAKEKMYLLLHRFSHNGTRHRLWFRSFPMSPPCSFSPGRDECCSPRAGFLDVPTAAEEHSYQMLHALPSLPVICTISCWCLDEIKGHTEQACSRAKVFPEPWMLCRKAHLLPGTAFCPSPAQRPKQAAGSMLAYGASRIRSLNNNQCFFLLLLAEHCLPV